MPLLALALSISTRGVVMMYLLLLIPVVALFVWAVRFDLKRRRRGLSVHDINTAAYDARRDADQKSTEGTAGL
jgi:hypothetical protein